MKARWMFALVLFGAVVFGIACKSGGGSPPPENPPTGMSPMSDGGGPGPGGGPMPDGGMP